ncbi:MAG: alkaline phosphatase family protein [Promethearchaeota archaeon]
MIKPDYDGGSIVNLMSTIARKFGSSNPYDEARLLSTKDIKDVKSIFLIIIDGLGYNYFKKHCHKSGLMDKLKGKLTSVFPSTTAAAMTAYYTGLAPLNHGIPAWFTFFKELGMILKMPPVLQRLTSKGVIYKEELAFKLLGNLSIFNHLNVHSYSVIPLNYIGRPYNTVMSANAQQVGYELLDQLIDRSYNILKNNPGKKFMLGYWPGLDSTVHESGLTSKVALEHVRELCDKFSSLIEKIRATLPDTMVIISADHGMVDSPKDKNLKLDDYPEIQKSLTLPLCGEPRVPFCYIHPRERLTFLDAVKRDLGEKCELKTPGEMIDDGYFGKFTPHERFLERLGDYILILKKPFVFKDVLLGEQVTELIGYHGGLSEDEMLVPLIVSRS